MARQRSKQLALSAPQLEHEILCWRDVGVGEPAIISVNRYDLYEAGRKATKVSQVSAILGSPQRRPGVSSTSCQDLSIAAEDRNAHPPRLTADFHRAAIVTIKAHLILSVEKYRHKAEINVKTKGATLNSVSETQDMSGSLGDAFDNIERRAKKEKAKLRERKRRKAKESPPAAAAEAPSESRRRVIRSRKYSMKPMSVDEALLLFESSRDEILVFRKFDTEKWAVLYRRNDGHFGLIEPE